MSLVNNAPTNKPIAPTQPSAITASIRIAAGKKIQ
jgi:hypothetical protein